MVGVLDAGSMSHVYTFQCDQGEVSNATAALIISSTNLSGESCKALDFVGPGLDALKEVLIVARPETGYEKENY